MHLSFWYILQYITALACQVRPADARELWYNHQPLQPYMHRDQFLYLPSQILAILPSVRDAAIFTRRRLKPSPEQEKLIKIWIYYSSYSWESESSKILGSYYFNNFTNYLYTKIIIINLTPLFSFNVRCDLRISASGNDTNPPIVSTFSQRCCHHDMIWS